MKAKQRKQTGQQIKDAAAKIGFTKFDVLNLSVPTSIDEIKGNNASNEPYVPFGSNNLFPEFLAEITRKSPTHRAILGQKKILSVGKEFQSEDQRLMEFVDDVNTGESLRDVYGRLMFDYYTFGNAYLEIVKHKAGVNLYHIDATKCRISKNHEHVYIHPDFFLYFPWLW